MTPDQAREAHEVLADYRDARAHIAWAVTTLAATGVPQTEIARESGLSREGVRKILARPIETAVCNACGWERLTSRVAADTCPECGQPEVNYFTPAG